jgi:NADH-quinone oxidoreductase E subunit
MPVKFSPEAEARFQELVARYPLRRAAIMPTLWLAQEQFGYVNDEVVEYIAGLLELSPAYVAGVTSFYTMFYRKPMGKYHVQVCTNLSCSLVGSETILEVVTRRLGIGLGEMTADGLFSLSEVECLGSCGTAPMMQINDDYWENLTAERTIEIIDRLDREAKS